MSHKKDCRRALASGVALAPRVRWSAVIWILVSCTAFAGERATERTYENRLQPIPAPQPLLADHPEFVEPIRESARFEAPTLVEDRDADLHVRAWRFSYNARGIIEMPNHLRAAETAVIMVHPWGIDDGQGWNTPEPAGVADFCTPAKNALAGRHTAPSSTRSSRRCAARRPS